MFQNYSPVLQTLFGTFFTWGFTAFGASLVFFINPNKRHILDISLGFAAGIMLAASFWSLLNPALEIAKQDNYGKWAILPVTTGFLFGVFFVYICDKIVGCPSPNVELALHTEQPQRISSSESSDSFHGKGDHSTVRNRKPPSNIPNGSTSEPSPKQKSWHRVLLLIIAITVHNIPEGLAVGVGFGAANSSISATFESARNLALGIGIQNFPEGLAVSLPLHAAGLSKWKSFWYGQLSGVVEPIAGVIGALAVSLAAPLLPYALAFAAGAMIFVVVDDIIPEAHNCGDGTLASWSCIAGFVLMMMLDSGLG